MNFWQVNRAAVQAAVVSQLPMVQAVGVQTDIWNGQVTLLVKEKHFVAVYEQGGTFYTLLNDGTVIQTEPRLTGLPYPLITSDSTAPVKLNQRLGSDIQILCAQLAKTSVSQLLNVSELHVVHDGAVNVYLDDGFEVTVSASAFEVGLANAAQAVAYFIAKGYAPGQIDFTGSPPYRYTPFQGSNNPLKGGKGYKQ